MVLLLLLTGCVSQRTTFDFAAILNQGFNQAPPTIYNNAKEYYSYYQPPSVGKLESTQTSNILLIEGEQVLVNLNIADIIKNEYYPDENSTETTATTLYQGSYLLNDGTFGSYSFNAILLNTGRYFITLNNQEIEMVAIVRPANLVAFLRQAIVVFRSVHVDTALVAADYSIKLTEVYNNQFRNFFDQVPPENSTVIEMMCSMTSDPKYCDSDLMPSQ